jgi:hypothetical protein
VRQGGDRGATGGHTTTTTVGLPWSICNAGTKTHVHHDVTFVVYLHLVMIHFCFESHSCATESSKSKRTEEQSAKTGGGKGQRDESRQPVTGSAAKSSSRCGSCLTSGTRALQLPLSQRQSGAGEQRHTAHGRRTVETTRGRHRHAHVSALSCPLRGGPRPGREQPQEVEGQGQGEENAPRQREGEGGRRGGGRGQSGDSAEAAGAMWGRLVGPTELRANN